MPFDYQRLKHLVVLMMENRSFDHMLGSLEIEGRDVNGVIAAQGAPANVGPGGAYHSMPLTGHPGVIDRTSRFQDDPPHDVESVATQLAVGGWGWAPRMDGFVEAYVKKHPYASEPTDVLNYYRRDQLEFTYFLADEFAICDRWFCSAPTSTMPNRLYSMCGDSAGQVTSPVTELIDLPSIFDQLKDHEWRIYAKKFGGGFVSMARLLGETRVGPRRGRRKRIREHCRDVQKFVTDAANGDLPRISFIEPTYNWLPGGNDDHPPNPIRAGQRFLAQIYEAVVASRNWGDTVFVITYDEHGGFYDHVPPETIPPQHRSATDSYLGWTTYGPRVPAILISPFAKAAHVAKETFEHCSILKFICEWQGIEPNLISPRVVGARSLAAALDTSLSPQPGEPRRPAIPPKVRAWLNQPLEAFEADPNSVMKAQYDVILSRGE